MAHNDLSLQPQQQTQAVRTSVLMVCAWLWALGWSVAAAQLLKGDTSNVLFVLHLCTGPVVWLAWWIGLRGYWHAAAVGLVAFILAGTAIVGLSQSDYIVASLMNIAVVTLFAGWALGRTATLLVIAVAQGIFAILVWQGSFTLGRLFPMMFTCLFLGAVTLIARRAYERHIAQIRDSTQALAEKEKRLRLLNHVVEDAPYSVLVLDMAGCVIYANPAFLEQSGYGAEEVLGRPSREVSLTGLSPQERSAMRQQVEAGGVWHGLLTNQDKQGQSITENVTIAPVHDEHGVLSYMVEIKQDITQRLQAQERLVHLQNFDPLTQLPNRYALFRQLERLLEQTPKLGSNQFQTQWHAMLMLDLDRFKQFNDVHGTVWADALLQAFALRLRSYVAAETFVARTTADQFVLLVEHVGQDRQSARICAYELATELMQKLDHVELHQGTVERVPLSSCIGFTVFPFIEPGLQEDAPEHIFRRCSVALNEAKIKGAGTVHSYSETLAESVRRRMYVEQGLHKALEQDQLRLYVQPQVNVYDEVVGLEALVRWQHPTDGLVSPAEFIPVAEASGLIIGVGDWVLEQVCKLLAMPEVQEGGYSISANVSTLQLQSPDFVAKLTSLLQRYAVVPRRLILEVTESMLLQDVDAIIQKMVALHGLGIEFAIDDFGTGYSSLAYLTRLPIQEIKMDQSFIRRLNPNSPDGALVQALLMVAKSRQLRVVAEGVELLEQVQLLQAWEPSILCQGYWFSKPIPAEQWLQSPKQLLNHATQAGKS